jgi:hypothetical protein
MLHVSTQHFQQILMLKHPLYSSDMAPRDIFVFSMFE